MHKLLAFPNNLVINRCRVNLLGNRLMGGPLYGDSMSYSSYHIKSNLFSTPKKAGLVFLKVPFENSCPSDSAQILCVLL